MFEFEDGGQDKGSIVPPVSGGVRGLLECHGVRKGYTNYFPRLINGVRYLKGLILRKLTGVGPGLGVPDH